MSYKGDIIARSGERLTDWAWSGRLSPRWVIAIATVWLLIVWTFGILIAVYDVDFEMVLPLALLMPGNVLGVTFLGRRQGEPSADEWQRARRDRAFMWGGNLTLGLVVLWLASTMGFAEASWFWQPQTQGDWMAAFLLVVTTWLSLTTIAAAWLTPSYAADLDDDD